MAERNPLLLLPSAPLVGQTSRQQRLRLPALAAGAAASLSLALLLAGEAARWGGGWVELESFGGGLSAFPLYDQGVSPHSYDLDSSPYYYMRDQSGLAYDPAAVAYTYGPSNHISSLKELQTAQNFSYNAYLDDYRINDEAERDFWPWSDDYMYYTKLGGDNGHEFSPADKAIDEGRAEGHGHILNYDGLGKELKDKTFYEPPEDESV